MSVYKEEYYKILTPLTERYLDRKRYSEIAEDPLRVVQFVCGCGKPGCKECGDDPKPAGCELGCKLCNMEPDVLIPLLCGQREHLRTALKDLWDTVFYFLYWHEEACEENVPRASELRALLLSCPATRYYLDNDEIGYPGFSADLLEIVYPQVIEDACVCPAWLRTCEDDSKWEKYMCFFCRIRWADDGEFLKQPLCECQKLVKLEIDYEPYIEPHNRVYPAGECLFCKNKKKEEETLSLEDKPTKGKKRKAF